MNEHGYDDRSRPRRVSFVRPPCFGFSIPFVRVGQVHLPSVLGKTVTVVGAFGLQWKISIARGQFLVIFAHGRGFLLVVVVQKVKFPGTLEGPGNSRGGIFAKVPGALFLAGLLEL